ncbi:hypothetical protein BJX68DRAFT_240871 [Aspergillus pseudodeflectus]|uniref:Uncharacterized protein n=1 Tax=Aspergillus pseudodeflectus TaxID=176178 RepID=A0ABR4K2M2_9EURO
MMNYQKYYPTPSTYPPHTISIQPANDPRIAPPLPPAQPPPPVVVGPPPRPIATTAAPSPQQPPAPPLSAPSYSHRPLRPSYDQLEQQQPARHEMPRSAPPPPAGYSYPPPDGPPSRVLHPADSVYAPYRRGEHGYRVSQANHGSRKKPHQDERGQGDSKSHRRTLSDRERRAVVVPQESESRNLL